MEDLSKVKGVKQNRTRKEEKRFLKNRKRAIIEEYKENGQFQKVQFPFNEFCDYIEGAFVKALSELKLSSIEIDINSKDFDEKKVDVMMPNQPFVLSDYATMSKKQLDGLAQFMVAQLIEQAPDNNTGMIDFHKTTRETEIQGVPHNDRMTVKIEKNGFIMFIQFINEEVSVTDALTDETVKVLEVHQFRPFAGFYCEGE